MTNETMDIQEQELYAMVDTMYRTGDVQNIEGHVTSTQKTIFQNEISFLEKFGLRKEFHFSPKGGNYDAVSTAKRTSSDGKVDILQSIASGKVVEKYVDFEGRKKHTRKTKYAFIQSFFLRSNLDLAYKTGTIICNNCGASLERHNEEFICLYCGSHYKAEALTTLLSRFRTENALSGFGKIWYVLLPIIIMVALYQAGVLNEEQFEKIQLVFSIVVGVILTAIIFIALGIGLVQLFKHLSAKGQIKNRDRHFSMELFARRIADLFHLEPQLLFTSDDNNEGKLFRHVDRILLTQYRTDGQYEFVSFRCNLTMMQLKKKMLSVRIKDIKDKQEFTVFRSLDVKTNVHYNPEQFTCPSCGVHEMVQNAKIQKCSFCGRETPMEGIDWIVLAGQ